MLNEYEIKSNEGNRSFWIKNRDWFFRPIGTPQLLDHIETLIQTEKDLPSTHVELCAGKQITFTTRIVESHLKNLGQTAISVVVNDIIYADPQVRMEVLQTLSEQIQREIEPQLYQTLSGSTDENEVLHYLNTLGINFTFNSEKAEIFPIPPDPIAVSISAGMNYIDGTVLIEMLESPNLQYIFLANRDNSGPEERFSESRILIADFLKAAKSNHFEEIYNIEIPDFLNRSPHVTSILKRV